MNMNIINLTPHTVSFYSGNVVIATIQPSGEVARVRMGESRADEIDFDNQSCVIPVYNVSVDPDTVTGLPEPQPNTIYIASRLVVDAAVRQGRTDVYSVHKTVRDENGRIIGCEGLAQ